MTADDLNTTPATDDTVAAVTAPAAVRWKRVSAGRVWEPSTGVEIRENWAQLAGENAAAPGWHVYRPVGDQVEPVERAPQLWRAKQIGERIVRELTAGAQ